MRIGQVVGMAFFFCSVWFRMDKDPNNPKNVFNRNGALFFATVSNFIPPMFAQLLSFPAERKVFVKEYKSRYYGVLPYYLSKTLIEVPFSLLFPTLFCLLTYYTAGFNDSTFSHFLEFTLMIINMTLCATSFGILIGCIFNELEVALNVAPLIFFPFMLFSGFYVNSESISVWVKWIEYISPFRYGLEAGIYTEFENTAFSPNPISTLDFTFGYWLSMLYLFVIGISVRFISFVFLFINAKIA